jgi:hypothetical protein
MGFKAFHSAQATIAGIETANMIRRAITRIELIDNVTISIRIIRPIGLSLRSTIYLINNYQTS